MGESKSEASPKRRTEEEMKEPGAGAQAKDEEEAEVVAQNPRPLEVDEDTIQRRNEIAAALLSYYEFLTRLHLPAEALKRPPEGGWPGITAERFEFMGKTDAAIDLLKHIPYISQDEEAGYQIYKNCVCWDYTGAEFQSEGIERQTAQLIDPMNDEDFGDEHAWDRLAHRENIVTIAKGNENRDWYIVVDVSDGKVALVRHVDEVADMRGIEYDTVKDLLEHMKERFRVLKAFATSATRVHFAAATAMTEEAVARVQSIYHEHGWPSAEFRKEDCLREISFA